ncbi:hypothetical protein GCM10009645_54040 [Mycolicibacterium poriferae]|uniref:Uncharacterized protein n=1 Tax=Mycolicibacterium poriferae TaxID=39694 RepID=A0A6N4VBY7_9MYCO|nr:hypothetical protein MPOR_41720 [Mycolicibacterium poriferae]
MAARGANVCRVHGGAAPQVKAAARRRLDRAADVLVQRLLGMALDGNTALFDYARSGDEIVVVGIDRLGRDAA